MRLAYLAFIAFAGGLTFLVLFIADQERQAKTGVEQAAVERISRYKIALAPDFRADPGLKLVSRGRPYNPTER